MDQTDPTLEQIHERCMEIQGSWSDSERRFRAGFWSINDHEWTPPQYIVHHTMVGQSQKKRRRELRLWDGVG